MKRFLMVLAISAVLIFMSSEAWSGCVISGGTSIPGCNEGGAGGAGGNANAAGGNATSNPVQSNNQIANPSAMGGSAEVKNVKTGDNTNTATVKGGDQSNQQKVIVPIQSVPVPVPGVTLPGVGQTHKPEEWVNTFTFKPNKMTYEQAEKCAKGAGVSSGWDGGEVRTSREIQLFWEDNLEIPPGNLSMEFYLGTAKAESDERSSETSVLCSAALKAMRKGAEVGFVKYAHQPQTHNSSWGIGGGGGGSAVLPNGGSPYAIAGASVGGFGKATGYVSGNLILHMKSFCKGICYKTSERENRETSGNTDIPLAPVDLYPNG